MDQNATSDLPKEEMRIDSLRYVTIFEIKNFEDLVIFSCKEAFSIILEIQETIFEVLSKKIKFKFEEVKLKEYVSAKIEYNKIVVFSKGNSNLDLITTLHAASKLMSRLVSKQILSSAHIAYGHFYFNDDQTKYCGKPYIMAYRQAKDVQCCSVTCDVLVQQNIEEVKLFINDNDFFSKMGRSLVEKQDVPLYGTKIDGSIVSKKMFVIDWPRAEIDIFGTIKEYSIDEFYKPYEAVYGNYNDLDIIKKTFFDETVAFLNKSLSQTIKLFNSTI